MYKSKGTAAEHLRRLVAEHPVGRAAHVAQPPGAIGYHDAVGALVHQGLEARVLMLDFLLGFAAALRPRGRPPPPSSRWSAWRRPAWPCPAEAKSSCENQSARHGPAMGAWSS